MDSDDKSNGDECPEGFMDLLCSQIMTDEHGNPIGNSQDDAVASSSYQSTFFDENVYSPDYPMENSASGSPVPGDAVTESCAGSLPQNWETPPSPASDVALGDLAERPEDYEQEKTESTWDEGKDEPSIRELKMKIKTMAKEINKLHVCNVQLRQKLSKAELLSSRTDDIPNSTFSNSSLQRSIDDVQATNTIKYHMEAVVGFNLLVGPDKISALTIETITPINNSIIAPEGSGSLSSGVMADVSSDCEGSQDPMKLRVNSLSSSNSSVPKPEPVKKTLVHPSAFQNTTKCVCSCFCQRLFKLKEVLLENISDQELFLTPSATPLKTDKFPGLQFDPRCHLKTDAQSTPKRQLSSSDEGSGKRAKFTIGVQHLNAKRDLHLTPDPPITNFKGFNPSTPNRPLSPADDNCSIGKWFKTAPPAKPDIQPAESTQPDDPVPEIKTEYKPIPPRVTRIPAKAPFFSTEGIFPIVNSEAEVMDRPVAVPRTHRTRSEHLLPILPNYFEKLKPLGGGDLDYECFEPLDFVSGSTRKTVGPMKKKSSSHSFAMLTEPDEVIARLGPIPKDPIFDGYGFVVTTAGPDAWYARTASSDVDTDISDSEASARIPLHIPRIKAQILAGGGAYYEEILHVPASFLRNRKLVVLSDKPSRTATYIMAMALNLPIYSHQLIRDACLENKVDTLLRQREYQLPLGRTATGIWVNFHHNRVSKILRYTNITLFSRKENPRTRFWQEILGLMGAKVTLFSNNRSKVDLISQKALIVDDFMLLSVREGADYYHVPMYTPRWIVDTLIANKTTFLRDEEFMKMYNPEISDSSDEES